MGTGDPAVPLRRASAAEEARGKDVSPAEAQPSPEEDHGPRRHKARLRRKVSGFSRPLASRTRILLLIAVTAALLTALGLLRMLEK